jgi:hypothetical protein
MTKSTKKVAWIFGLLAGAAGVGGAIYYVTRPKTTTGGTTTPGTKPTTGGTTTPSGTTITPTLTPGVYAAVSPFSSSVSWVDQNGKPIGQGGGAGDGSTATVPR